MAATAPAAWTARTLSSKVHCSPSGEERSISAIGRTPLLAMKTVWRRVVDEDATPLQAKMSGALTTSLPTTPPLSSDGPPLERTPSICAAAPPALL
eukprot:CAMPEP_0205928226 /NCGR_PEP_ID=MMETSP1325-20131115/24312_1 /ASSEMBLY_ACC=CAM_ASM_000708 /TAXON_ID=236786 /ORGANISM="Florenciella sp., Strain RCC1007" /LENGTH=95 /DNA_ID=CAMNT_0053297223 /DNA_START=99 /DNA_END=386 /DNA_ORIENTATION=-